MSLTRKASAEITRQNIIQAAFEIAGDSGYEALTTNALIQRAGIAKGTLYHHFKNLDEVVFAVIRKIVEDCMQSVPIEQFNSMREYLYAVGQYQLDCFFQDPRLINTVYGFLPKGMQDPQFRLLAQELLDSVCAQISPAIKQFYSNTVSDEKVTRAIRMVDIFSIGFGVHQSIYQDKQRYQAIWQDFVDMLESYLNNS
ncbi:TetR/AcrR family transcriptional regulator [Endozoicomonas sp. SM1973]|uniref:TetR/AcrR family transcriptional regulator n=1 Tax=Spartinivicinus marinus TaxID=2994442 RepID=A0A853IKC2_9GAMM|nr:TetR/AcrR family transcriptional regulator [Spartinivicinus marinus]MCX4025921.1 TetR/AcrR family transcriptional regulator [Spartinivicinus marinus]NYZ68106.1 TetR/AcrR family transcriptional regulator [Spartinivicinus marinus]